MTVVWLTLATAWSQSSGEAPTRTPSAVEQRAGEIYANGLVLYQEGLYIDAIAAFEEAYRLARVHGILLNIANAYERLQRLPEAVAALNRYRAFARPDEAPRIQARIAAITQRMAADPAFAARPIVPLPLLPPPPTHLPATTAPSDSRNP